jgi:signal transduction histidine kinase
VRRPTIRHSLTPWIVVFATVLALVVTLTVLWHVALVNDYNRLRELSDRFAAKGEPPFHWGVFALGSAFFIAAIILVAIMGSRLFSEIRWNERQHNFIASVSHELNSPLSSIKLYAQTLKGEQLSLQDKDRFLEVILSDVDRLAYLIRNILQAAQVDRLPVRPEYVPVEPYLEAYVAEIKLQLERKGGKDALTLEPVDPELHAALDRTLFRQVLDNLVDNAVKYSKDGHARISIAAREKDGRCEITVTDDGLGIPRAELWKIFDRFYRIEGDLQRSRKGTGLGLFIVRSIVEGHEGTISAESEGPGRGATFRVRVPLAPGASA